jgi:hypothetical protein
MHIRTFKIRTTVHSSSITLFDVNAENEDDDIQNVPKAHKKNTTQSLKEE